MKDPVITPSGITYPFQINYFKIALNPRASCSKLVQPADKNFSDTWQVQHKLMNWEKMFHVNHSVWMLLNRHTWEEGGGGVLNKVLYMGASALRSDPFPIYVPFQTEQVPLSYTFYSQMVPISLTQFRSLHPFELLLTHCVLCENTLQKQNVLLTFSQL